MQMMAQSLVSVPRFLRGGIVVPHEQSGVHNDVAAGLTSLKCNGTHDKYRGTFHSTSPYKRQHQKFGVSVPARHVAAVLGDQKLTAEDGDFNPQTVEEAISQAWGAVQRAIADGQKRQQLQFLLPVDQRQFNYLDTEPRDYPCGIGEEFAICQKVVSAFFKQKEKTELVSRRIGEADNEMDPVGLIYPSDKSIAAIIFPIAETLKQIESLASKDENMPLLLVNPQWRLAGNVISDFGFGPWKRKKEEFVNTFTTTYTLLEQRVGEASNVTQGLGGVVRILKCYPGDWRVYLMDPDGTSEMIGEYPEKPSYKALEPLVAEARKRIPWKAPPRILGGSEPAPPPLPKSLSGYLSDAEIDEMEVAEIRRALMALGLPSSGRVVTLKDRLKEAQKKMQN
ncbi:unnamed protein product [Calypogeia fissa]